MMSGSRKVPAASSRPGSHKKRSSQHDPDWASLTSHRTNKYLAAVHIKFQAREGPIKALWGPQGLLNPCKALLGSMVPAPLGPVGSQAQGALRVVGSFFELCFCDSRKKKNWHTSFVCGACITIRAIRRFWVGGGKLKAAGVATGFGGVAMVPKD